MLRGNLYLPPGTFDTYTSIYSNSVEKLFYLITNIHIYTITGNHVAVTRAGVGSSTDSCQSILAMLGQRIFSQSFAAAKGLVSREISM